MWHGLFKVNVNGICNNHLQIASRMNDIVESFNKFEEKIKNVDKLNEYLEIIQEYDNSEDYFIELPPYLLKTINFKYNKEKKIMEQYDDFKHEYYKLKKKYNNVSLGIRSPYGSCSCEK
jgi:phosphoglycerate-specific signal transduction histidine kinase